MLGYFCFFFSCLFWCSDFDKVRLEIIMLDDSSRFRYSSGYVFCAKFLLDNFDFSNDFHALDFLRFAKIRSQSQFQAAELNWRQFHTKSQMKSAPKLVPFFTLNLNTAYVNLYKPNSKFLAKCNKKQFQRQLQRGQSQVTPCTWRPSPLSKARVRKLCPPPIATSTLRTRALW